ncbi:MAG TPA: hypothetical protein VGM37_10990 [Armatimonadota bacterium]|jgi:mannose-6-phosphate isomerase-like protein (cupin superfamily)
MSMLDGPKRPYLVMHAGEIGEALDSLRGGDGERELTGGSGAQLRVTLHHEENSPGTPELHMEADDVFFVLEGSAAMTLGGELVEAVEVSPGEWRGAGVAGGEAVEIASGDIVIVPRGTAHHRVTLGRAVSLAIVKVRKDPIP